MTVEVGRQQKPCDQPLRHFPSSSAKCGNRNTLPDFVDDTPPLSCEKEPKIYPMHDMMTTGHLTISGKVAE